MKRWHPNFVPNPGDDRPTQHPSVLPGAGVLMHTSPPQQQRMENVPYQIRHHLLHVFCALFHLILGVSELDNITFLCWVWKVDDNLG